MDEYIEQLLAEMHAPAVLQDVVRNILDAPIPEAVKKRLLKPLLPEAYRPIPPPRKARERKRKAITEEFDPVVKQPKTIQDYQKDILDHPLEQEGLVFRRTQWAIGDFLRGWQMNVPQGLGADPLTFLEGVRPQIRQKLTEEILAIKGVKFQLALKVQLRKDRPDGGEEYTDPVIRHKQETLLRAAGTAEINEVLDKAFPHILETLEKWTQRGSGWVVDHVCTLWLDIARYQPLRGGSYIPLPAAVQHKKAVVNVKNTDDQCVVLTILAAMFPVAIHPERSSKYPEDHGFDFTGIDYPTPISQISRIEKQNPLAINVFGWDKGVIIHRLSERACDAARTTVNMLLIEKAGKFHYTWIKNLNRLLYNQSKYQHRKHFCERCLHGYTREDLLEAHKPDCRGIGQTAVRVEMPKAGENKLTFQNHHKQFPAPFVIYADFEALTTKIEGPELDPSVSNTQRTQLHETCSYCYVVVRCDGKTETPVEYRGPDAAEHFLRAIQAEERIIKDVLANPEDMRMTPEDILNHSRNGNCHICEKPFACAGDSVRDHCHITGKYRGAAHNACNLKLRLNPKTTAIPVVFLNLRGYDSHLLMQAISRVEGKVSCIPNNTEKYISFSLGQLRFIDSAQFLLAPLDKLVAANPPETFQITARYEPRRELLLRKGVYPYEHMDSWERFADTQLPPKASFYSKLTGEPIKDEDYAHAQKVWETFGIRNLGEYCDLYCRTDVLLLADVFETFRKTCMGQYNLDPAHYYTSPGLSWDALLKKTGVELELLTDYDQHLFIEKGMRGGISMVSKRYAKANNHLIEGYNSSKPNTHILYLDANNLYGWAMSQPLPTGDFQWVGDCALTQLAKTITEHPADSRKGFILEVDLEYPGELHAAHNAYPLAPERMVVKKEWMSEYQHGLLGAVKKKLLPKVEKLVPNLYNKNRYVLHYRNLQLYTSLGMKLTKVHRALSFQQSCWMEPYIRLNTELRTAADNDFEKDLFKLMNNSVYGKTMENLRNRVDVKLVRADESDRLRRLIASPRYARANIFDDDLAAIQMHKSCLKLLKPIYVGMSVLDLSKHRMYDFYYNELKKQYGEHCQLLYTDTDSLLLEIQTENVYEDMGASASLYDTSNYPKDHPQYSEENKKVVGKMKDECAGRLIVEYVGLRPKMYAILKADDKTVDIAKASDKDAKERIVKADKKEIKTAKGVKKSVVSNEIRYKDYKEALLDKKTFRHGMDVLRSERHHIYGQHLNKISLSPFDSKRWISENGIDTLAYGHDVLVARDAAAMDAYFDELVGGD